MPPHGEPTAPRAGLPWRSISDRLLGPQLQRPPGSNVDPTWGNGAMRNDWFWGFTGGNPAPARSLQADRSVAGATLSYRAGADLLHGLARQQSARRHRHLPE